jgi:hypothetical protein
MQDQGTQTRGNTVDMAQVRMHESDCYPLQADTRSVVLLVRVGATKQHLGSTTVDLLLRYMQAFDEIDTLVRAGDYHGLLQLFGGDRKAFALALAMVS